ncbi:MAG: winged helix-turn-helix domain-containing protein [Alphaproteobacteria bacterium]|jgi:uncharacterized protein YcaQ
MPDLNDAARPLLRNADARRLFLHRHGLSGGVSTANGDALLALIEQLGFVQIDSINTVARAHHMILSSRSTGYRPAQLKTLLERRRALFEHWTHDASVIPASFYPYWRRRFDRDAVRLRARWKNWRRDGFEEKFDAVLTHIRDNGPTMARDMGEGEARSSGGWWDWHPSKTALEYLWRTGALAISGRQGFQKIFDLTERVVLEDHLAPQPTDQETIDWACNSALDRLGFATSGEIAAFWETVTPAEAKAWAASRLGDDVIEIDVEGAVPGKPRQMFARPDVLEAAENATAAPSRLRVLSPFDPALRDRRRAEWLFNFRYRIEIFVPEPKRIYGYYVFPLLEGDRLVGRIDMKRHTDALVVKALWPEAGVKFGKGRLAKLSRELDRMAKFAGCSVVRFEEDWLR